ncbi:MAG: aspartyl protease family protein [Acidobacteriota bacterium]
MRRSCCPLRSSVLLLTLFVGSGCLSAGTAPLSEAEVQALIERLRTPTASIGAWRTVGHGTMRGVPAIAWLRGDGDGRFAFELDTPVRLADTHDGTITTKLYPWGSVLDVEGREEEMTLIPSWVLTGYWLAPTAPVTITAGAAGRRDGLVALQVRHRDGTLPFEVLIDEKKGGPVRVQAAVGVSMTTYEMDVIRVVNSRPVPGVVRVLKGGNTLLELRFEPPSSNRGSSWPRPKQLTRSTYHPEKSAELEVRHDGNGFFFVRPVINGKRVGWFLFDTGAPATILGKGALRTLALDRLTESDSSGVGGSATIGIHAVDTIELGPVRMGPALLASMDVSQLGWPNIPIAGIVGCDLIGKAVVEHDIVGRRIVFHDPAQHELPDGASWTRLVFTEGKPVVTLSLEGHRAECLVDTAASGTLSLSKPLVDRLNLLAGRSTRSSSHRGVGGSVAVQRGALRTVELGGRRYENLDVSFAISDQGSHAHPYPDGLVGIQLLDDFRVVFDLAQRRMAFVPRE